jgi:hypothetical protein
MITLSTRMREITKTTIFPNIFSISFRINTWLAIIYVDEKKRENFGWKNNIKYIILINFRIS